MRESLPSPSLSPSPPRFLRPTMESPPAGPLPPPGTDGELRPEPAAADAAVAQVDPFLKEALQNPRHRVTILRMELDVQKFMQTPELLHSEFPYFPTSYLRLAAHRVAQHYGLHSIALDNGNRIVIRKTPESKYPSVCLSQIVVKQSEPDKIEPFKIATRPRLERASSSDLSEFGGRRSVRSVEERKEEYEKARARIFSGSSGGDLEGTSSLTDGRKNPTSTEGDNSCKEIILDEVDRISCRDSGSALRVAAIFKDQEKDRSDPDYDRSYDRYFKSPALNASYSLSGPFMMPQPSYVPYEAGYCPLGQLPRNLSSINYGPNPLMSSFPSAGSSQTGGGSTYINWPSPAMIYAQSYEHFRHAVYQVPVCQQPLSFDHLHNR